MSYLQLDLRIRRLVVEMIELLVQVLHFHLDGVRGWHHAPWTHGHPHARVHSGSHHAVAHTHLAVHGVAHWTWTRHSHHQTIRAPRAIRSQWHWGHRAVRTHWWQSLRSEVPGWHHAWMHGHSGSVGTLLRRESTARHLVLRWDSLRQARWASGWYLTGHNIRIGLTFTVWHCCCWCCRRNNTRCRWMTSGTAAAAGWVHHRLFHWLSTALAHFDCVTVAHRTTAVRFARRLFTVCCSVALLHWGAGGRTGFFRFDVATRRFGVDRLFPSLDRFVSVFWLVLRLVQLRGHHESVAIWKKWTTKIWEKGS